MKALVLKDYLRFAYEDVPDPRPGPGEVLVRVKACGICGSDVHGMDGRSGRRIPPIVMGHEAAGVVAATGDGVTAWSEGDRVTFDSTVWCGECAFCRQGRINLCDRRRVLGVSCEEYRRDGAFAEFVAVPERILYRLPEAVSFSQAAMVEPVSIAFHAVRRAAAGLAETAVVVGAGMIGLLAVQLLRRAGCGPIVAVDVDRGRLELARRMGADEGVLAEGDAVAGEVRERAGGGADVAFEAVGSAPAVRCAIASLRKGGRLGMIGNLSPEVPLPLQHVVTRELTLYGSCASCGEYPACLELIARGAVRLEELLSAEAALSEGAAWFDRLHRREPGLLKVLLVP